MLPARLIACLADGCFHSGEALATELGVTRAAVWKQVGLLSSLGLDVQRVRGRGYRLADPLELLSATRIRASLPAGLAARFATLEVVESVPSTNARLLGRDAGGIEACLAEHQSAGRGRDGRSWTSPFGANLCASVAWTFASLPRGIQALSLAVGVGLAEMLARQGLERVRLKWPNDLVCDGRKLGGILVELRGESLGRTRAVVGVGLNLRMPASVAIDQPWTDLHRELGAEVPGRNALAAATLAAVLTSLDEFTAHGFASFAPRWSARDALRGARVEHPRVDGTLRSGTAVGIDADGALLVEGADGIERVLAGEVRVRWS